MQSLITFFWTMLAIVCVVGAVIPFLAAEVVCMMSAGAETRSIRESGLPLSYDTLEFGEWQDGAGKLVPTSLVEFTAEPTILRHRIGQAVGVLSVFTFAEAEYELEDGSIRIAHAAGTVPLISARKSVTVAAFALFSSLTVLFTWLGHRSSKRINPIPA